MTTSTSPQLVDPAAAIARGAWLLGSLGLTAGDRVVVLLRNDVTTFGVLAAACLEGIVPVPLPVDLGPTERDMVVRDAAPAVIVADPEVVRGDPGAAAGVRVVTTSPSELSGLPGRDPSASWPRTRPMAYTSGTTGRRKGVHVGVHDPSWGAEVIADEHDAFDRRHGDRHLVVSPLYHSGPFRFALVTALTGGRLAVLPRFDVDAWRHALRQLRPTSLFCVPTHLHRLVASPGTTRDDLASLTLLAHAGAPCPQPVKRTVLELAPTGSVWEFYGSTEGQFTVCPPAVWHEAPGTVGRARPGRRLRVRDGHGRDVPAGTVGTVWCEVPHHARFTYWGDAERTAAAWAGEAFTVGDLGSLDTAGRLHLAGRPGDLVISGGVNVYPAEVERHLLDHPDVAEAVVFGVPDPDWGERVVAAVVARPGTAIDGDGLRRALGDELVAAAVPKRIVVVDDLPRTSTGKIRRVGLDRTIPGPWSLP